MPAERPAPLLTPRAASARFDLAPRTLRAWLARRRLACWPFGWRRVDAATLARVIAGPSVDEVRELEARMHGALAQRAAKRPDRAFHVAPEGVDGDRGCTRLPSAAPRSMRDQPTRSRRWRETAHRGASWRTMSTDPEHLTVAEAADYLAASRSTIRRWTSLGFLRPAYTPGGSPRYALAELRALLTCGAPRPARGRPFAATADRHSENTAAIGASRSGEALARKLKRVGCDPFAILAAFALDESDRDRQLKAAEVLASYVQPKLKAGTLAIEKVDQPKVLAFDDPWASAPQSHAPMPAPMSPQLVEDAARIDDVTRRAGG